MFNQALYFSFLLFEVLMLLCKVYIKKIFVLLKCMHYFNKDNHCKNISSKIPANTVSNTRELFRENAKLNFGVVFRFQLRVILRKC